MFQDDEFGEDIFKIFDDFDQPHGFDVPNPSAAATDGTQIMSYPSPVQSFCPHDSDHLYCKPSEGFSISLCCNQCEASPMGLENLTASPSEASNSSMFAASDDVVPNPENELSVSSSGQDDFLLGDSNDGCDFFSLLLQDIGIIPDSKDPSELVSQSEYLIYFKTLLMTVRSYQILIINYVCGLTVIAFFILFLVLQDFVYYLWFCKII